MTGRSKPEPRWDGIAKNIYDVNGFEKDLAEGKAHEKRFQTILMAPTWEHKWDRRARETGRIYFEYAKVVNGAEKPSGIFTSEARWLALEYAPDLRLTMPLWMGLSLIKLAVERNLTVVGGDGKRTRGAMVPLEWFLRCWVYVDLDQPPVDWEKRYA